MVKVQVDPPDENKAPPPQEKPKRGRPKGSTKARSTASTIPVGRFCFDIETGPAPPAILSAMFDPDSVKLGNLKDPEKISAKIAEAKTLFIERAALDPLTGRVLAIGVRSIGDFLLFGEPEESELLINFWTLFRMAQNAKVQIVGWNIHDFDLPFLINRSRILNVAVPAGLRHGRYWESRIIDLMKVWTFDRYGEYAGIDVIGRALGLGGKLDGVDGSQFASLWSSDRELAVAYLRRDVELLDAIADRLTIV